VVVGSDYSEEEQVVLVTQAQIVIHAHSPLENIADKAANRDCGVEIDGIDSQKRLVRQ